MLSVCVCMLGVCFVGVCVCMLDTCHVSAVSMCVHAESVLCAVRVCAHVGCVSHVGGVRAESMPCVEACMYARWVCVCAYMLRVCHALGVRACWVCVQRQGITGGHEFCPVSPVLHEQAFLNTMMCKSPIIRGA